MGKGEIARNEQFLLFTQCFLPVWRALSHFQQYLKGFAADIFEFDENVRKFSKRVENTVGNGEIARYEQFLHFTRGFSKDLY